MTFNERLVELTALPKTANHAIVQFLVLFIIATIIKHLIGHTLPVLYHEGNAWFRVSLKERFIQLKSVFCGASHARRLLDFVRSDSNSRSPPAILNRLDHYGRCQEWHPEPGEEKRTLLSQLINQFCLGKEDKHVNFAQVGSFAGYATLLVSSLIPADSDITVIEPNQERRDISAEMANQLANNKRARFVDSVEAVKEDEKPFDLIFITSDSDDECFHILRQIEARQLVKRGTGWLI